ncbi:MAG: UDP-N-acetylglucosamine acyltransferase [Candidatus Eremiobacteraeota bacterium]|nr:UDP-N-acetylglucosamine acyltransferase [Candidatus Eremiobacteraeota bacterium]
MVRATENFSMTSDPRMHSRFPGMIQVGDNFFHSSAVVGPDVVVGKNNVVGPFAVIVGNVQIGDGNWFGPHTTIGTAAQYATERNEYKETGFLPIRIGSHNTFREYTTVHEPSSTQTLIEDHCYFMSYSHVSHDTIIRSKVTLTNGVQIGGFTEVQYAATVGLLTTIHQFTTIGAFSMVGMSSVVAKDLPPFLKWTGNPARCRGVNSVGLRRHGFSQQLIDAIAAACASNAPLPPEALSYVEEFRARNAETGRAVAEGEGGSASS